MDEKTNISEKNFEEGFLQNERMIDFHGKLIPAQVGMNKKVKGIDFLHFLHLFMHVEMTKTDIQVVSKRPDQE